MGIVKDILSYARGLLAGEIESLGLKPRNEDGSIDRPSQVVAILGSLLLMVGLVGMILVPVVLTKYEVGAGWKIAEMLCALVALLIGGVLFGWSQRNVKSCWD